MYTFDPRTLEPLAGRFWSVGIAPEGTQSSHRPFSQDEIGAFAADHARIFDAHANAAVGGWQDPETGLYHLDLVGLTPSKRAALELAQNLGEKSIFHLDRMETVPTGVLERPFPLSLSLSQRFEQLDAQSPHRTQFAGVHYSDAQLPLIDGGRRGMSGIGAEGPRLQAGSKSGMGPDAPPGFYAYTSGALAEPQMRARKFAHPITGEFSFADISKEPSWQDGLDSGMNSAIESGAPPELARSLGLNSAEHAVRDSGYDGYFHPSSPHIRFLFDNHRVQ